MRLSIAAALLLLATPARAAEWQLVGGNDRINSYIDMGSIVRSGNFATVMHLTTFHEPVAGAYGYGVKITYDCTSPNLREFDGILYSATGAVIRTDTAPPEGDALDIPAGSVEESGQLYACFGKHGMGVITDPFAHSAAKFGWKP